MPLGRSKKELIVDAEEREKLLQLSRRSKTDQRGDASADLPGLAEGATNAQVAKMLGLTQATVQMAPAFRRSTAERAGGCAASWSGLEDHGQDDRRGRHTYAGEAAGWQNPLEYTHHGRGQLPDAEPHRPDLARLRTEAASVGPLKAVVGPDVR